VKSQCCERGRVGAAKAAAASCFDSIYTRRECCGGGWARLFPVASAEPPAWEDGAHWNRAARGHNADHSGEGRPPLLRRHPAFSHAQHEWEIDIANASTMLSEVVLGQHLRLYTFKRAGPAFDKVLGEMRDDLYRLRHVATPPPGERPLVVDVGASVGVVAVLLAKLWGARVVAVEPAPANFRYLLWNLKVNGVAEFVWPVNVALGTSASASQAFFYSPTYPTWSQVCDRESAVEPGDDSWRGGWTDWQVRFDAEAATLAELLAALGVAGDVHLLKVDCEGCEWGMFAEPAWGRLRHRVRHVAAELHRWALEDSSSEIEGLVGSVRQAVCVHEERRENSLCTTM